MKVTNSKYFYYGIIVLSLTVIAFSVYYQLGGFKKIEVKAYPEVDYVLAGVEFRGKHSDPEIKELYETAKALVLDGRIRGTLSWVDYLTDDLGQDEVHYFIGIILDDRVSELPPDYRVRKFQSRGVLGVRLDIHPLVRPPKDKIEGMIYAAAQEHGLEVENFFLEKHYPDDRVMVEGFVK